MKRFLLVLAAVFVAITLLHAADNSDEISLATGKMLYFRMDNWLGMVVATDKNPEGYSIFSEDFENIMKRVPASYKDFQERNFKMWLGIFTVVGSTLVGGGLIALSASDSMVATNGNTTLNYALTFGGLLLALAGDVTGLVFIYDSNNLLYMAVHEYNKAMINIGIRGNGAVGLQKNINF